MDTRMRIGELARRAGVTQRPIRHVENEEKANIFLHQTLH